MPPKKIVKKFDIAKLQKMQEPITIRVVKTKGQQKTPVNVQGKDGGAPGTGWSREDVLALEQHIQDIAGGGYYDASATDANGVTMEWVFGWDARLIPEKTPPGSEANQAVMPPPAPVGAPGVQQVVAAPTTMPPMSPVAPLGGNGYTGWLQAPQTQPQTQPQFQQAQPGTVWWPGQQPMMTPRAPVATRGSRERELEQRLRQQELDAANARYQQQIDRMQMAHQTELSKIREELRRTAETPKGESEEVKLLREQLAESRREQQLAAVQSGMQAQIDKLAELITKVAEGGNKGESEAVRQLQEQQRRAEERAERDRAEQRHREEMRALEAKLNSGPDPMIEYLKESTRMSAEAQKEIARSQRESSQLMTNMMINPTQMIDMMQRSSGKNDEVTRTLVTNFGSAFETYRQIMESVVSMSGGGAQSPGLSMLQEGMARASEIANQYMAVQRDKAVHEARAKAQVASAQAKQAEAYKAQADAVRQQAQGYDKEMLGGTPPQGQPHDPTRPTANPPANGANGTDPAQAAAQPGADVINLEERRRPTEEDMFGAALESVQHLRQGVADGQLAPQQAVAALLQGIAVCEQQEIVVPAFTLFAEGRFADLWDALLPEVPQEYKDVCTQMLHAQFQVEEVDDDGDGDHLPA